MLLGYQTLKLSLNLVIIIDQKYMIAEVLTHSKWNRFLPQYQNKL